MVRQIPDELMQYFNLITSTRQHIVSISTAVSNCTSRIDSKIGGEPYLPQGANYPQINGTPCKMLVQLNCSDFKLMHLDLDMPKKGIIQFWYPVDDYSFGIGLKDGKPNHFCIFYPDIAQELEPLSQEQVNIAKCDDFISSDTLKLHFTQEFEYLSFDDEYACTKTYSNKIDLNDDELAETFYNYLSNSGSKIGGYAFFTQSDPRMYGPDSEFDDWVLLLQIDTDENLMWGDSGVGNWFIRKSDLAKRDFSKILFNWDCC